MVYPKTGSILDETIRTGLSTQIFVSVNNVRIGGIQQLSISQNRNIDIIEEIGNEGNVDSVPKGSAKIDIVVERIVMDTLSLPESFSRSFKNIQAQRIPFIIEIMDTSTIFPVVHTCEGCWFSAFNPKFLANNYVISENATIKCERITSSQNGLSAVNGGLQGILYEYDEIERDTDVNGIRGRYTLSSLGDPLDSF